jgi:hypothetical protein
MSLSVQFIYDTPQREIASILNSLYQSCVSASYVAGFMTVEGIEAIAEPIAVEPSKLATMVIGAGTWRAFEAFDRLLGVGIKPDRLRVHLGHSRPTGTGARYSFYRYHPMLHSKVYLFELRDGNTAAFVGSHNLTGFALCGLNGEAGVLIEGPASGSPFPEIRTHIGTAGARSVQYDPSQRDAYAWWAGQFMEGFADKFNDLPREGEAKNTIVILAETSEPDLPVPGDVIYFELPAAIGKVQSLRAEVHLFIFDTLPHSPIEALHQLGQSRASFWCKTIGVEDDRGGTELRAGWLIDGSRPALLRAPNPFRPTPAPDMQQVRVKTFKEVRGEFEYLFETAKLSFDPVFDREDPLTLGGDFTERLEALKIVPPEHYPWFRVTGIRRKEEPGEENQYKEALRRLSPSGGSFILMSMRRRSTPE